MSETNKKSDIAFSILTLDIVTNILALSDNPGKLGQYLTDEIRELTGARTVVVVQCLHKTGKAEHSIVTVNPHRRRNIIESPQFESLIDITHNLEDITWWHQKGDSGKAEEILAALGLGLSIAIPLHIGDSREGAILLFDLPQERHIDRVIEMLRTLCPVVALILRNSFLYTQQENIIAERTSQLEEEIAERKQAEEAVRISEEKFSKAFRSSPNTLVIADLSTRERIEVNETFSRITGYSREELLNTPVDSVVIDKERFEQGFQNLRNKGSFRDFELGIRTKSGQERIMLYSGEL